MNLELSPDAAGTFVLASDRPFIQRRLRRKLVRALRNQAESQNFNLDQVNPAQSSLFENFSPDDIKAKAKDVISMKREDIKARIGDVSSLPEEGQYPISGFMHFCRCYSNSFFCWNCNFIHNQRWRIWICIYSFRNSCQSSRNWINCICYSNYSQWFCGFYCGLQSWIWLCIDKSTKSSYSRSIICIRNR